MTLEVFKEATLSLEQSIKNRDEYNKGIAPFDKEVSDNKIKFQKAFCGHLLSKEVLTDIVWSLRVHKTSNGNKGIQLLMPDANNKFYELVKKYAEVDGPLYLEFQQFAVKSENPRIYLKYDGLFFSSNNSIDEQIDFIKSKGIKFDTSYGWEHSKGFVRILKRLDSLYD